MRWTGFSECPQQLLYSRVVTERNCPHPAWPLPGSILASPRTCEDSLEVVGGGFCTCTSERGVGLQIPGRELTSTYLQKYTWFCLAK